MAKYRKTKNKYKKRHNRKKNSLMQKFLLFFVFLFIAFGYLHNIGLITNNDIKYIFTQIGNITKIDFSFDDYLKPHSEDYSPEFNLDTIANNTLVEIDSCDLSGDRQPNAKVDIGYGNREYFAYTNQAKQLVYVDAQQLTLQDKTTESLTATGRYCSDEANVEGVEDPNLDQGHAIADSIGGVANAYNITPQDSNLNRHGEYSDFEKQIRDALKAGSSVTDFECIIIYDNTHTQIPSAYYVSFKINGTEYSYYMLNEH